VGAEAEEKQETSHWGPRSIAAGVVRMATALASAVRGGTRYPSAGISAASISLGHLNTFATAARGAALDTLRNLERRAPVDLDPRLQLALTNDMTGKRGLALAVAAADEIAVIARVADPVRWAEKNDVADPHAIGRTAEGGWIVTGRIPSGSVHTVRAEGDVHSLKASEPLVPLLSATRAALNIDDPLELPAGETAFTGKGVVIGIIDFGCDFAHRNFRDAAGATRIEKIWYQAGVERGTSDVRYGRLFTATEIDEALLDKNPFAKLGYGPPADSPHEIGAHGTHVMDIAAGNGIATTVKGIAPEATLIFIEASSTPAPSPDSEPRTQDFSESVQLLDGVRAIFDWAGNRPCVVNISLGANGGPHDGSSLVEQGLDSMVREKPNRAIVIAAGNAQEQDLHTSGTVSKGTPLDLDWIQSAGAGGAVQIWYGASARLRVTLIGEDGTSFGPVEPGDSLPVGAQGQVFIFIANRLREPNNGDNMIWICLGAQLPGDSFKIRLENDDEEPVDFHAWIDRNDGGQSRFASAKRSHTLASISTGHETIVVGAFDAHKAEFPLAAFSSTGPTRDGRRKPEISAPGKDVRAARSRTDGVVRKSGTSMAAPAVAGLIALLFEKAARQDEELDTATLRDLLQSHAAVPPPTLAPGEWSPEYGYGRASAKGLLR
jgi:subtilisin family serine protease